MRSQVEKLPQTGALSLRGFATLTTKPADPQRANAGAATFVIKDSRVNRGGGQWEYPPGDGIVIGLYLAHIFKDFP